MGAAIKPFKWFGDQGGSGPSAFGVPGMPGTKASGAEEQGMGFADELAGMAREYWKQTGPLRSKMIDRSTRLMGKDFDVRGGPVYRAGRNTLEDQYGVAQEQMLSAMPSGGGLQQGMADLAGGRADSLANLASQIAQDEYNKAYGIGVGSPQISMTGMTQAGQGYGNVMQSQAANNPKMSLGCCFIFITGHGFLHPIVRRYRDLKMNIQNRRGYYWLSDRLVPWMVKSRLIKSLVSFLMVKPMTSYGKHYFGLNRIGAIFTPITAFWLLVYSMLGHRPPYRRKGTMEVV